MPELQGVSAALWHLPEADVAAFSTDEWFDKADLDELKGLTDSHRAREWVVVRLALKAVMLNDGVADSARHIHIRKNDKGMPHAVVYNPDTGRYARYNCSLSHKGPLVVAAYSLDPRMRVGIDIERRSWRLPYLGRRFISEHDKLMDTGDRIGECTVLWAFKEAATKLLGVGMAYGLCNVQCRENGLGKCELRDAGGTHYSGQYMWFGKYALAVVTDMPAMQTDKNAAPRKGAAYSWRERMSRARRLRTIRKQRNIAARLEALKTEERDDKAAEEMDD